MKHKTTGFLLCSALLLGACGDTNAPAQEAPVRVSKSRGSGFADYVIVRSLVDRITIKNINVNRGQCLAQPHSQADNLVFAEKTVFSVPFCAAIIEVSVRTDQGDWTFDFSSD